MASLLALRNKCHSLNLKPYQNLLTFSRFYSSSSSRNDDNVGNFSSYFNQQRRPQSSTESKASTAKPGSFDEIRKNLSEFRRRTSSETPFPANSSTQNPNLFQNKYNQSARNPNPSFSKGNVSFETIRENLQKLRGNHNKNFNGKLSLSKLEESFKMKPTFGRVLSNNDNNSKNVNNNINVNEGRVIGGSVENLSRTKFGKDKENEVKKAGENDVSKFELLGTYSHAELGVKLRDLRPDTSTLNNNNKKKKGKEGEGGKDVWFSLSELQQRLGKLREIEEKEYAARGICGAMIGDLRKSFQFVQQSKDEIAKNPKIDIPSQASLILSPPKEHLVDKYFHPDNISAAEKLKLELQKVRDEFKMSESDCGSTRVQIAQLTTEIIHLSSVLHKKDKHSRRGLQAKVQQRKKLLKYLRRTDWDSYCFVISKLGLRDNPDYKS